MKSANEKSPRTPNKYGLVAVVLALSLALCLLAPLWKKEQFPYTGTWTFNGVDKSRVIISISFNDSGSCSVDYSADYSIGDGRSVQRNGPCTYKMSGYSAITEYGFVYQYSKDMATRQSVRAKARITPVDNGKMLKLEKLEIRVTSVKGVQTQLVTRFKEPAILLEKE